MNRTFCKSCGKPIAWVTLTNSRAHPMDWTPDAVAIAQKPNWETGMKDGHLAYDRNLKAWRVLRFAALEAFVRLGGTVLQSHFDTCPNAGSHRRKR